MRRTSLLFCALMLIAAVAGAQTQSLADLAKKEKERRRQVTANTKVITNLDAAKYRSGPAPAESTPVPVKSEAPAASADAKAGAPAKPDKPESDEPKDFQGRTESWWRQTMADARKKVKELENAGNVMTLKIADLQNQFYREANGFRQQDIQREIQKGFYEQDLNKENLAKARRELEDLEKEARKSGALPGWLGPS
jgi:hypothetical protein